MNGGHELVEQVYAAKTDPDAADSLIRQYMGFLRAETAKYLHRAPIEGQDEELSIVLLAFYEAILGYKKNRGAFLAYASRGIRNRLIDYYRKEKKHTKGTYKIANINIYAINITKNIFIPVFILNFLKTK